MTDVMAGNENNRPDIFTLIIEACISGTTITINIAGNVLEGKPKRIARNEKCLIIALPLTERPGENDHQTHVNEEFAVKFYNKSKAKTYETESYKINELRVINNNELFQFDSKASIKVGDDPELILPAMLMPKYSQSLNDWISDKDIHETDNDYTHKEIRGILSFFKTFAEKLATLHTEPGQVHHDLKAPNLCIAGDSPNDSTFRLIDFDVLQSEGYDGKLRGQTQYYCPSFILKYEKDHGYYTGTDVWGFALTLLLTLRGICHNKYRGIAESEKLDKPINWCHWVKDQLDELRKSEFIPKRVLILIEWILIRSTLFKKDKHWVEKEFIIKDGPTLFKMWGKATEPLNLKDLIQGRSSKSEQAVAGKTRTLQQDLARAELPLTKKLNEAVRARFGHKESKSELKKELRDRLPNLIILGGHAGDGKSELIIDLKSIANGYGRAQDFVPEYDATTVEKRGTTPTRTFRDNLDDFFQSYHNATVEDFDKLYVIAINTGIARQYFQANNNHDENNTDEFVDFKKQLGNWIQYRLGLIGKPEDKPDLYPKDYKKIWVFDLDNHRHLNPPNSNEDKRLLDLFFDKLDIGNRKDSIFDISWDGKPPTYVRTNLADQNLLTNLFLLTVPEVRKHLQNLLFSMYLRGNIHLSPRNIWNFFNEILLGPQQAPPRFGRAGPDNPNFYKVKLFRLLPNLLFSSHDVSPSPFFEELKRFDPTLQTSNRSILNRITAQHEDKIPSSLVEFIESQCSVEAQVDRDGRYTWRKGPYAISGNIHDNEETLIFPLRPRGSTDEFLWDTWTRLSFLIQDGTDTEHHDDTLANQFFNKVLEPDQPEDDFHQSLENCLYKFYGRTIHEQKFIERPMSFALGETKIYQKLEINQLMESKPVPDEPHLEDFVQKWLGYRPKFMKWKLKGSNHFIRLNLDLYELIQKVKMSYEPSKYDIQKFPYILELLERIDLDPSSSTFIDQGGLEFQFNQTEGFKKNV